MRRLTIALAATLATCQPATAQEADCKLLPGAASDYTVTASGRVLIHRNGTPTAIGSAPCLRFKDDRWTIESGAIVARFAAPGPDDAAKLRAEYNRALTAAANAISALQR